MTVYAMFRNCISDSTKNCSTVLVLPLFVLKCPECFLESHLSFLYLKQAIVNLAEK